MEDIFGDIPDLNISTLIDKGNTIKQPTGAKGSGRFRLGPDIEEETKVEGKETSIVEKPKTTEISSETKPIIGLEEEVEIPEEGQENQVDGGENKNTQESIVKILASALKEKGVIDYSDEEFKDEDDFIPEVVGKSITKGVQEYKDNLPEEIKTLINNYEDGVPLAQLLESEQRIFEISSIQPEKIKEDSRLQEDIVASYMANTGWTQSEIDEKVKDLQDAGLMEKEALRAHTKLVQIEKDHKQNMVLEAGKKKQEQREREVEQLNKIKSTINSKTEFFQGIPTNDIEKKSVFEAITKRDKFGKNEISQLLSNEDTYIKVAYFLKVMKGDLSKLKTVAKTEVVNGVKKTMDQPTKAESRFGKADLSTIKNFLKR